MDNNQTANLATELPLRPCVGIVLFNHLGQVWMGRRLRKRSHPDTHEAHLWQFPQGGIEPGEDPAAAAKRELWEETNIKSIKSLAEIDEWLSYELPKTVLDAQGGQKALEGKFRGQKQKWFAFLFTGDEREIVLDPPPVGDEVEFDAWGWRNLKDAPAEIVAFKRDVYKVVAEKFAPIAKELAEKAK